MHRYALIDKPYGVRTGELDAIKRLTETKELIEASINSSSYIDECNRPIKNANTYSISHKKPPKLGVIGPNLLSGKKQIRPSTSASLTSPSRKASIETSAFSPTINSKFVSKIGESILYDVTSPEEHYKRMPETRLELVELNDALDEMLAEIRINHSKSPQKMLPANVSMFYDGSVSGMEKSIEEAAVDAIMSELSCQALRKAKRIQNYYRDHYKTLVNEMQAKIDFLCHELEVKERKVDKLTNKIKTFESQNQFREETFEEFVQNSGSKIWVELEKEKQEAKGTVSKLAVQLDTALDRLDSLRKENHEIGAELNVRKEQVAQLQNRERYLTEHAEELQTNVMELKRLMTHVEVVVKEENINDEDSDDDDNDQRGNSRRSKSNGDQYPNYIALSYRLQSLKEAFIEKKNESIRLQQEAEERLRKLEIQNEENIARSDSNNSMNNASLDDEFDPESISLTIDASTEGIDSIASRPKLKLSKTVQNVAPPDEIMREYFHCSVKMEKALRDIQNIVMFWGNNLLERAFKNTKLISPRYITDVSTSLCDGVIYGLILKQMKADCGSSWRDDKIDEALDIRDDHLRCGTILKYIPGFPLGMPTTIPSLTPASSQAALWHTVILGMLLQLSATPFSSDPRFIECLPEHSPTVSIAASVMDGSVGGGSLSSSFASSVAHFEFTEPVSTHLALLLKEQGDTNINLRQVDGTEVFPHAAEDENDGAEEEVDQVDLEEGDDEDEDGEGNFEQNDEDGPDENSDADKLLTGRLGGGNRGERNRRGNRKGLDSGGGSRKKGRRSGQLTARDSPDKKRREESGGSAGKGKRKKRIDDLINPSDGTKAEPIEGCLTLIVNIYESKAVKDLKEFNEKSRKVSGQEELPKWMQAASKQKLWEFCREYTIMKYGIKKIAEKKLASLAKGCITYADQHSRIRVFSALAGVIVKSSVPIRKSTSIPDDLAFAMRQGGGPVGLSYTDTATRLRMNSTHIANPIFKLKNFGDDVYAASFAVHFLLALVPAKELSIRMGQPGVHEMLVLKSDFENAVCDFLVLSWFNDLSISHMLAAEIELLAQKNPVDTVSGSPRINLDAGLELVMKIYPLERNLMEIKKQQMNALDLQKILKTYVASKGDPEQSTPATPHTPAQDEALLVELFKKYSNDSGMIKFDQFSTMMRQLDFLTFTSKEKCTALFQSAVAQSAAFRVVFPPIKRTTSTMSRSEDSDYPSGSDHDLSQYSSASSLPPLSLSGLNRSGSQIMSQKSSSDLNSFSPPPLKKSSSIMSMTSEKSGGPSEAVGGGKRGAEKSAPTHITMQGFLAAYKLIGLKKLTTNRWQEDAIASVPPTPPVNPSTGMPSGFK